jgi:pyruvate dehydrogenase E2 component (dihydrolipoamide acetyltransferase)
VATAASKGATSVATDFTLPELGENITAGDVLRLLVKPGDTLVKDQPVLELETDKATIEVPSSVEGQVKEIKVKAGDKVTVGQAILSVEDNGAPAETAAPKETKPRRAAAAPAAAEPAPAADAGDGTADQAPDDKGSTPDAGDGTSDRAPDNKGGTLEARGAQPVGPNKVVDINRGARPASEPTGAPELPAAPAAPSVRRMARELGVDVNQVAGSGPAGRISVDDVKAHAKQLVSGGGGGAAAGAPGRAAPPLPDFSRWGEIERQPMRAVRRKTAEHLTEAWTAIPHVTQHDLADITNVEELRKRYAKQVESAGGVLTITAIATKVIASALKAFPQVNSSIDVAANEIVLKKYVNIGIAVDTDRGLLVPVIKNADTKNIIQISIELSQLSEKARSRKISLDEMQGGTFSISNLGGIGGSYFTPIVNTPEVAILGISRARMEPLYNKERGDFVPRLMLPLSLSYDHRVVDGADGIRFLRWVVEALEQPFLLALQG